MAFCSKCGTAMPADVLFCPNCGAQREDEPAHSAVVTDPDVVENKALAVLCYAGPFFIVPLIAANTSPYVRFHLNNGLWLLICYVLCACVPIIGWAADVGLLCSTSSVWSNARKARRKVCRSWAGLSSSFIEG